MTAVGFLGLGRMGAPMAANLLGHVERLLVHDLSEAAVAGLVAKGAEAAGSAAALGERCGVVFMSLPTPPIVRASAAEAAAREVAASRDREQTAAAPALAPPTT